MRQLALGATAADVVNAGFGGTLDFLNGQAVARSTGGFFSLIVVLLDQYAEALSTLKLYSWRAEP